MLRLALVVVPGFQMMDIGALSVFEFANRSSGSIFYELHLLSQDGGIVPSSLGVGINTNPLDQTHFDTVIVCGGVGHVDVSPELLKFIYRASGLSRRVAAICTGAFVLAEAGILDGRQATTHWIHAAELERRFPKLVLEPSRIFVVDGPVWTTAGMSASIDMALSMVENDLGSDVARSVGERLVINQRRAGGQSQHSALLDLDAKTDRIQNVLEFARCNLQNALSVEELAGVANLSPRQFSRAFNSETGQSPAKAVENIRVEAARVMMEQGRHSMDTVAIETGFADRSRMRRAFLRAFGQAPQTMRRNARSPGDLAAEADDEAALDALDALDGPLAILLKIA